MSLTQQQQISGILEAWGEDGPMEIDYVSADTNNNNAEQEDEEGEASSRVDDEGKDIIDEITIIGSSSSLAKVNEHDDFVADNDDNNDGNNNNYLAKPRRTITYLQSLPTAEAKLVENKNNNAVSSSNPYPDDTDIMAMAHDVVPVMFPDGIRSSRKYSTISTISASTEKTTNTNGNHQSSPSSQQHEDRTDVDDEIDSKISATTTSSSSSSWERASLISVSMNKGEGANLGIRIKPVNGELIISFVEEDSILKNCLQCGDHLQYIDEHYCAKWSTKVCVHYLREKRGPLSITVQNLDGDPQKCEAIIIKTKPDSQVGIVYASSSGGQLTIKRLLTQHTIGSRSILNPGDFVQRINDIPCGELDASIATDLIRQTPKYVKILVTTTPQSTELSVRNMAMMTAMQSSRRRETIVANEITTQQQEVNVDDLDDDDATDNQRSPTRPSLLSLKLSRHSTDVKLGISFKLTDGNLCISRILDVGLLNASILKSGMEVVSINNIYCRKWDPQKALRFFDGCVGDILIIAQDKKHGDPLQVAATAFKASPRAMVGVAFRNSSNTGLEFNRIDKEGLFADSVLSGGDSVLAINNILCNHMTMKEAVSLVKGEPTSITIHTKTHTSTGIILSKLEEDRKENEVTTAAESSSTNRNNNTALTTTTPSSPPQRNPNVVVSEECCIIL